MDILTNRYMYIYIYIYIQDMDIVTLTWLDWNKWTITIHRTYHNEKCHRQLGKYCTWKIQFDGKYYTDWEITIHGISITSSCIFRNDPLICQNPYRWHVYLQFWRDCSSRLRPHETVSPKKNINFAPHLHNPSWINLKQNQDPRLTVWAGQIDSFPTIFPWNKPNDNGVLDDMLPSFKHL